MKLYFAYVIMCLIKLITVITAYVTRVWRGLIHKKTKRTQDHGRGILVRFLLKLEEF